MIWDDFKENVKVNLIKERVEGINSLLVHCAFRIFESVFSSPISSQDLCQSCK
ncbi:hypothetical protein HMPREF0204_11585 [Chryseobacterium gleum ATCC 35910]|uniref:Uncharacterized protein n=1 Tax=Chryseobacterium gleum ATCC 35910 TaxID=525257 RepID=A0ABP2IRU9_CHRGE|nr:hypothetical protein HMPREF0204_11585 [Chryseobacterium gleum ATCC 35910]